MARLHWCAVQSRHTDRAWLCKVKKEVSEGGRRFSPSTALKLDHVRQQTSKVEAISNLRQTSGVEKDYLMEQMNLERTQLPMDSKRGVLKDRGQSWMKWLVADRVSRVKLAAACDSPFCRLQQSDTNTRMVVGRTISPVGPPVLFFEIHANVLETNFTL